MTIGCSRVSEGGAVSDKAAPTVAAVTVRGTWEPTADAAGSGRRRRRVAGRPKLLPWIALALLGLDLEAAVPALQLRFPAGGVPRLQWTNDVAGGVVVLESAESLAGPWISLGAGDTAGALRTWADRRDAVLTRFFRLRASADPAVRQPAYDLGTPAWRDVWVDGVSGDDENDETHDGTSRARAFRSLGRAWRSLPDAEAGAWASGYRIRLAPGRYRGAYLEDRHGAAATPVLIEPADGAGTVSFTPAGGDGGNLTFFQASHVCLQDFVIDVSGTGGDALQFERCDHVLLRRMTVRSRRSDAQNETLKVNQSQHVYVEDSEISGAGDNCIDMVAVQYGHIVRCRIHESQDWAAYLKGGSAYFLIEGNEIYDAGTGGFTVGQGSGLQFMVPPWLHYEAYDVKLVNNLIHDTEGAGFGVNGGFNVLFAHNTLVRVGSRSHALEFVFGGRTCDGRDVARCQPYLDQGGWGQLTDEGGYRIPNRHVLVANNVLHNPAPFRSQWQHFQITGAAPADPTFAGPEPARGDDGLVITGNVIWNGPSDLPLGIEDSNACPPENAGCSGVELVRDNAINTLEPDLAGLAAGDYRPSPGGALARRAAVALTDFGWNDAPTRPAVPAGNPVNQVARDYTGRSRPAQGPPGAFLP